jgi:hypothetical protein
MAWSILKRFYGTRRTAAEETSFGFEEGKQGIETA